jgi:AbrB family looped-hinge helix DNA binding protein
MKEIVSVVTRKGQITLPAEMRRSLGIKEGDKIALAFVEPDREQITLRPVRSVAEMTFGAAKSPKRCMTLDQLRQLFEEESADRALAKSEGIDR